MKDDVVSDFAVLSEAAPAALSIIDAGLEQDLYAAATLSDVFDRALHASVARGTGGLSPAALAKAYWDWAAHLTMSPGKQIRLLEKAVRNNLRLINYAGRCVLSPESASACIDPLPHDRRFSGDGWERPPFNLIYQGFLLNQQWWHYATTDVSGVTKRHEKMVEFASRQLLDMYSPSNFLMTNPESQQRTLKSGGANLFRGFLNLLEDFERVAGHKRVVGADAFKPGVDVATTPGKVIFRNQLIELIQYLPTTDAVRPEPVLIVPAWIMKYYILDLSPGNSLVRHLTAQGFTVFMISWKNPGSADRDLGMDDYRKLGVLAAVDAISALLPASNIHATGYCLGGTLLSIAAAAMARDKDHRLQSITLFAAQTDFTEAGELTLFINESQVDFLEDLMWEQGYLDANQMSGAFQLLRSNDLIWSHILKTYLMGEREPMTDLMAWNADATRLPYKMHSEYLRQLFLNNDFVEGRLHVGGKAVALTDIRVPIFAVGAEKDHVAPWRSTFKIQHLTDTDVTYLLTTGGHNAGIIPDTGRKDSGYRIMRKNHDDYYADADEWLARAQRKNGLWWPEWTNWLASHSGGPVAPPSIGGALCDAPGTYVFQG